ncbi:MAG TPA: TonB family protein [Rhizomicrobium sp.]|jgi:TonB family protein|nr:TonB family protein [Rhizomicrobium sp.]
MRLRALSWIVLAAGALAAPPAWGAAAYPPFCNAPGITPPMALTSHAPTSEDYPPLSVMQGETGTTAALYTVLANGAVGDVTVVNSSGSLRLDDATTSFIRRFQFKPALRNGTPLACNSSIAVRWNLNDSLDALRASVSFVFRPAKSEFPAGAAERGEEGAVMAVMVLGDGDKVENASVMQACPFADLNNATLAYLRKQPVKSAVVNGRRIRSVFAVMVEWTQRPGADPGGASGARPSDGSQMQTHP